LPKIGVFPMFKGKQSKKFPINEFLIWFSNQKSNFF